jgi:hypothetical protein
VPVPARGQRFLRPILKAAYQRPETRAGIALSGHKRQLVRAGLDPAVPITEVTADEWHRFAVLLGGGTLAAS